MKTNVKIFFFVLLSLLGEQVYCQCDISDSCEEITSNQTFYPKTLDGQNIYSLTQNYSFQSGCLDAASPEASGSYCGFNINPTIWYKIKLLPARSR